MITVHLEPENETVTLSRVKTVIGLLGRLDRHSGSVLVIRDGGLLTPDVRLKPGDTVIVRTVVSQG